MHEQVPERAWLVATPEEPNTSYWWTGTGRTNLCPPWIGYKKAYDSMPHTRILEYLELYKINRTLAKSLHQGHDLRQITEVSIKCMYGHMWGISQYPLWAVLCLFQPLLKAWEPEGTVQYLSSS